MTKFDFKKWVIKNKHGKKSLDEQMMRMRGRGEKSPLTMCSAYVGTNLSFCYRFSECVNGQNMGGNEVILNDDQV